jgi:hypothetical protein
MPRKDKSLAMPVPVAPPPMIKTSVWTFIQNPPFILQGQTLMKPNFLFAGEMFSN